MEKLLIQIESCRKDHERRDNTFTESVLTSAYNKLKEYYDLEEQGLLLRLPCKVGDVVYKICPQSKFLKKGMMWDGKIIKTECQMCPWSCCDCTDIGFKSDMNNVVREIKIKDIIHIVKITPFINKIYYLTREEAEKALEKMKGDSNDTSA